MSDSNPSPRPGPVLRVSALATRESTPVLVVPGAETRRAIADDLGLIELRKLRFEGRLEPEGRRDWRLVARLGATVVQPCVVTLAPVTTRIDEDVTRAWRADFAEPEGDEVEVPEVVDDEPLGQVIDIGAVMVEALALALPVYPRAEGAALDGAEVTEPGKTALSDDDVKPFAGLAGLRDKLTGGDDPERG